jgi:hypothetical protein
VPTLGAEGLDSDAGGPADPQRVQGRQEDQGVAGCRAEPGGQKRAEFVPVQGGGATGSPDAAGEWPDSSFFTAYLQNPAIVHSRCAVCSVRL